MSGRNLVLCCDGTVTLVRASFLTGVQMFERSEGATLECRLGV
jgi:hypothetical protein